MSKLNEQIEAEDGFWADFDSFLSKEQWSDCEAMIDNVGELGYENLALRMHQALNRAKALKDARDFVPPESDKKSDPDDYRPEYPRE